MKITVPAEGKVDKVISVDLYVHLIKFRNRSFHKVNVINVST